jgi:hypothetical protein
VAGTDAEKRAEGGMSSTTAVEAEDELIEVGLKVFAAQAMIDAKRPNFKVGEDAFNRIAQCSML